MSLQGTSTLVSPLAGARDTAVADSGGYYVALSPTPGSGIAGNAAGVATFAETTPYLYMQNQGNLTIYPTHIHMHMTTIGVGNAAASQNITLCIDSGVRYTSGGTALTIANLNGNSANKSSAFIVAGGTLVLAAASTNRRIIGHQAVKHLVIEVVHDSLQLNFGGAEQGRPTSLINNGAFVSHYTVNFAPVALGPGHSLILYRWVTANSQMPAWEIEMGFVEK